MAIITYTFQKTFGADSLVELDKKCNEFIKTHKVVASQCYGVTVKEGNCDYIYHYCKLFYVEESK